MQVGFLGAEAIVQVTNSLPQLIQKSCGAQNRRAGFYGLLIPVSLHRVLPENPGCKPFSGGNRDQNIKHHLLYSIGFAGYITLC
mgnify:CR=1 FL=1